MTAEFKDIEADELIEKIKKLAEPEMEALKDVLQIKTDDDGKLSIGVLVHHK